MPVFLACPLLCLLSMILFPRIIAQHTTHILHTTYDPSKVHIVNGMSQPPSRYSLVPDEQSHAHAASWRTSLSGPFFFFNQIIKWKVVQFILLISIFHRLPSNRKIHHGDCALFATKNWKSSLTDFCNILHYCATKTILIPSCFSGTRFWLIFLRK